jgi:hypothetical protein
MNNLAWTFSAQGDVAGARALEERVVEVRRCAAESSVSSIPTAQCPLGIW